MNRVATHDDFSSDLLKTKQSVFTLALASSASHQYFYRQFQSLSPFYEILSAKHLTSHRQIHSFFSTKTTDHNYIMCQASSVSK